MSLSTDAIIGISIGSAILGLFFLYFLYKYYKRMRTKTIYVRPCPKFTRGGISRPGRFENGNFVPIAKKAWGAEPDLLYMVPETVEPRPPPPDTPPPRRIQVRSDPGPE